MTRVRAYVCICVLNYVREGEGSVFNSTDGINLNCVSVVRSIEALMRHMRSWMYFFTSLIAVHIGIVFSARDAFDAAIEFG